jgi:serine/threonine protein kinase
VAGRPYFALEYIADGTLAQHLKGAPQPARLAAQFVEVLARAVHAAHTNGVVHRDLKPANILLVFDEPSTARDDKGARPHGALAAEGRLLTAAPKIADFGVAKCVSGDSKAPFEASGLTVTGDLLGTPSYMAPEQAAPTGPPVGPAADIYALGAILYELLTGRPPFKGATLFDTVLQVLHSEPVSVTSLQPTVPRDLDTICHKCLRKEPRHRYQSASELADDLQKFLRGQSIKARPRGTVEKVWRWAREHPVPTGLVGAGVLTPLVALWSARARSTALRNRQSCSKRRRTNTARSCSAWNKRTTRSTRWFRPRRAGFRLASRRPSCTTSARSCTTTAGRASRFVNTATIRFRGE